MTETRTAILGCTLCLGGGSLGALVLVGRFAGMEPLLTGVPRPPPMAPDAAFGLLLLGIAGALLNSRQPPSLWQLFSRWIGAVVVAIGIEIAVRYALGIHLPAGHFFFHNRAMPYPWRQSPPSAAALIFLGAAIIEHAQAEEALRLSQATAVEQQVLNSKLCFTETRSGRTGCDGFETRQPIRKRRLADKGSAVGIASRWV